MNETESAFRHHQVVVSGSSLHVVEAGGPAEKPVLFLHGWPESWHSWQAVMNAAVPRARAIAIDLPGIGQSTGVATDGSKRQLAETVHRLIERLGLKDCTLVGQDVGGMIAYAYLRAYDDIARAVIMNVVIPGVDPWDAVLRNPYVWHFAMHAIPELPERLVQGRQGVYFDYFYDILSHDPAKLTAEARTAYVAAYASHSALTAGFNWYRTFQQDAEDNRQASRRSRFARPLLYLRGEHESGDMESYVRGFREAGIENIQYDKVSGAGHFTQEEAPGEVWRLIADFANL
jgi:pimeloyl-ACP methyl ester carboxylesterase